MIAIVHTCPVCGWGGLDEASHGPDGSGSFEICPSGGVEFGYDDATRSHDELRAAWVRGGMKWSSTLTRPPLGWDPAVQLTNLPRLPTA